ELADVGVVELRDSARLTLEALGELLFRHLHRNDAIQASVPGLIHLAHPTRADGRDNLIGTQPGSGRNGHTSCLSILAAFSLRRAVDEPVARKHRYHWTEIEQPLQAPFTPQIVLGLVEEHLIRLPETDSAWSPSN